MKVARDSFLTSGLRCGRWRRGSWLLEVQIAFVMLGIGLAGLCPFVVMQLKQLVNLESRFMATSYTFHSVGGDTLTQSPWPLPTYYTTPFYMALNGPAPPGSPYYYYLVPWKNPWAQKLTTRAQLLTTSSNESDNFVQSGNTGYVNLQLAPLPPPANTSAVGQVTLTLDGNGNATAVTAWVQVNSGTGS